MEKFKLTDELKDSAKSVMSGLVGDVIELSIDEIEGYEFPQDRLFGLMVPYNDDLYCFTINFSSTNKNFICMGPGARNRQQLDKNGNVMKPPFFVRWTWHKYFEESVIAFADPMMFHSDDISIAWCVGDDCHWPLEDVALIIEKLARNQKVINDNILFFGSSGGGYTSVVLGTLVKNSKVLVNNAQFFVLNYGKQFIDALFELLEVEFNGMSREEITERILYRLDAVELFKRQNYSPFITYYINSKSKIDIKLQCPQLIDGYFDIPGVKPLNIIIYEDTEVDKPHNPLPFELTLDVMYMFCRNYLYNSSEDTDTANIIERGKYDNAIINDELKVKDEEIDRLKREIENLKSSNQDTFSNKILKIKNKFK
jgi:hypothetical protein